MNPRKSQIRCKRPKQRYIIIKLTKFKNERIIKAARKNNFFFKKRFYLFIFRERGRERERKGEKHQCIVVSHAPPAEDQAYALTGN